MVEHRLPKPGVEGSNPFSRSIGRQALSGILGSAFLMPVPLPVTPTGIILVMIC